MLGVSLEDYWMIAALFRRNPEVNGRFSLRVILYASTIYIGVSPEVYTSYAVE
jgi:hypothetical protein